MKLVFSIPIPGGILVSGGYGSGILKTSEIVYLNGLVKQAKPLPEPRNGHCMAEYQGQIFSTGGWDGRQYSSTVWMFNNYVEFTLTNKPEMNYARYYHACGIFNSSLHGGRPLLVVAGGLTEGKHNSEYLDFTVSGSQWQICSKS